MPKEVSIDLILIFYIKSTFYMQIYLIIMNEIKRVLGMGQDFLPQPFVLVILVSEHHVPVLIRQELNNSRPNTKLLCVI